MGNRVKGRTKRKSIKAALSSSAGSKRKLSRMGKRQKKEHAGLEASFIGRSKCLKMLQITIKDFRRLCILKGVYPREPIGRVPGKKKGQSFYHIKDIRAIAHEPVLEKFREFRAFMKKVRRAAGRNEIDEAARKNSLVPTYTLHHLVKERYPRFTDALADMDDALTLTYLFAALPAAHSKVKPAVISKAKTLAAAWGAYCATTSCITKSFISVKGVYMEATIQDTAIRWVIPHAFTQHLPEDVDFRIMRTFLEFYETMLNFVMFKLYNDIGVRYPFPVKELVSASGGHEAAAGAIGNTSALLGTNLRALTNALDSNQGAVSNIISDSIEKESEVAGGEEKKKKASSGSKELVKSVGAALSKLKDDDSDSEADGDDDDDSDDEDVAGPLQAALENVANEEVQASVAGKSSVEVDDETIKRRRLFEGLTFFLSREVPRGYLEIVCLAYGGTVGWEGKDSPISVNDSSITHHIVDRPKLPSSYESLPKSREFIQPQWIVDCANFMFLLPISKYSFGATLPPHLSPWVDDEEEGYKPAYAEEIERLKNGETINDSDEKMSAEEAEASSEEEEEAKEDIDAADDDDDEEDEHSDEDEHSEKQKKRLERKRKKEEEEAHMLAKNMMGRKAARLYGRMQHGIAEKQAKVDELHKRRQELECAKGKDSKGRTVVKQKVERLKNERRDVEKAYSETGGTMKKSKKKNRSRET